MTHLDKSAGRASFLSPPDFHRLDWACRPIYVAYESPPYLVGSVLHRESYRDIDLRLILTDDEFAAMIPNDEIGLLLNIALSGLIARAAGLATPIDFQIQQMTAANEEFGRQARNPMGIRHDQRRMLREAQSPGANTPMERVEHAIQVRRERGGRPGYEGFADQRSESNDG